MLDPLPTGLVASSLGLGLGAALGARAARRRTRTALAEALHELRRPLQALALLAADERIRLWVEEAGFALAELERGVEGAAARRSRSPVSADALICEAQRRWRGIAELEVADAGDRRAEPARLEGDPRALGAALDNLIANAVEHGAGPVRIAAGTDRDRVRLSVTNPAGAWSGTGRRAGRRGQGLRITRRLAAEQGGSLTMAVDGRGQVRAAVELPRTAVR